MRSQAHLLAIFALFLNNLVHADTTNDPWDLSFYRKGAAIGDSYAAGIGAGNSVHYSCSRYDGSYSNLVAQQLNSPQLDFSYKACSGAVIADIRKQANALSSDQEFVIVSAGGNDANLVSILNSCIYRFFVGDSCENQITRSSKIIRGLDFSQAVHDLISDIKPKLSSNGKIYYVGYGKFWDTTDNVCDEVSWHVFYNVLSQEFLTRSRRIAMNSLVDDMNTALREVIKYAGDQVVFVEYDDYIELTDGRYCQPGQDESKGISANRDQLFFYEMKTTDSPWFDGSDLHKKLKQRDDEAAEMPEGGTLGSQLGDMIAWTIYNNTDKVIALADENTDNDLQGEVSSVEAQLRRRQATSGSAISSKHWSSIQQGVTLSISTTARSASHSPISRGSGSGTFDRSVVQATSLQPPSPSSSRSNSAALSSSASVPSSATSQYSRSINASPESMRSSGLQATRSSRTGSEGSASIVANIGTQVQGHSNKSKQSSVSRGSRTVTSASPTWTQYSPSSRKTSGSAQRLSNKISVQSQSSSRNYASGTVGIQPPYPVFNATSNNTVLGTKVTGSNPVFKAVLGSTIVGATVRLKSVGSNNITTNATSLGTVMSNTTHVLMADGSVVEKSILRKLFVSDTTARVFHPTQYGHAVIANTIIYLMAADRAKTLGVNNFPRPFSKGTGEGWLDPVGVACKGGSTDTWATRDPVVAAVQKFCEDPAQMRGKQGSVSSKLYNAGTLDYVSVSVEWDKTANLTEHGCKSWLDAVADSCDAPGRDGSNPDNWKHGGLVKYHSSLLDATLDIQPLSVRRIWDGGQRTSGQYCYSTYTRTYLDQPTLKNNIADFCKALSAQRTISAADDQFRMDFNEGTPDRVRLLIDWPKGPKNYQVFPEECVYYMTMISDGCNVPDISKVFNPMNWKHGGEMRDNNGIQYTIQPQFTRPSAPDKPQGGCQANYRVLYYTFSIWGQGYSNGDFGQNSLLPALKRCGATTAWKFDYYDPPRDDDIEWMATGTLPISIGYKCLGWAVGQAGGPDVDC